MFAVNFRLSNRKIAIALLVFTLAVVSMVAVRLESFSKTAETGARCADESAVADYISSFGLEIGGITVDEITVPGEFNDVYSNYNDIQKSQGFDLSEYKGKILQRYTCTVTNYPEKEAHVFAEVLTYQGTVVGADIYSTEADGFISALK